MKGIHTVEVTAKRIKYRFELRRNLTIIRGDSATGKTTLIDMIQQHMDNPSGSPVQVSCDKKCYVLSGSLWKDTLSGMKDSIVFIDEGNEFTSTDEFAETIRETDNYYVIVTREALPSLPYSIEEIYGIHESGKYGRLQQTYNEFYRIYTNDFYDDGLMPQVIITEDSNSGYQFFQSVCEGSGMKCVSANGKSNIFQVASKTVEKILCIADGAAFGPEMDKMMKLISSRKDMALYLPESFEWMILESGLLTDPELKKMLNNPSDFIESRNYFSWERFFTDYLIRLSDGSYLKYKKRKLNPNYTDESAVKRILAVMPGDILRTDSCAGDTDLPSE